MTARTRFPVAEADNHVDEQARLVIRCNVAAVRAWSRLHHIGNARGYRIPAERRISAYDMAAHAVAALVDVATSTTATCGAEMSTADKEARQARFLAAYRRHGGDVDELLRWLDARRDAA